MTKNAQIEVLGKHYPIKFGYGAFRILGEKWNLKGIQSVVNEFQKVFPENKKQTEITFEGSEKIGDLVFAGMEVAKVENFPDRDDTLTAVLFGDQIEIVMDQFVKSLPQSGNPQPRKPAGKKKK